MTAIKTPILAFLLAILYFLIFKLNGLLFSSSTYAGGVNWIYLPSGLRLIFVLVFAGVGAFGVGLSTLAIAYLYYFHLDTVTIAGVGLIAGFAPWYARHICVRYLKIDTNLHNLSATGLLKISLVFALVSPVMQQLWLTWRGETENFLQSATVMAVGDLAGTLLVLYFVKLLLKRCPVSVKTI